MSYELLRLAVPPLRRAIMRAVRSLYCRSKRRDHLIFFVLSLTVWGVEPVRHPGLKAQVSVVCHTVVCHKTKLVRFLLKEEPNVPLLVIWTRQ